LPFEHYHHGPATQPRVSQSSFQSLSQWSPLKIQQY